ncbi:uncharacterized protein SPPG_09470 [Spizellomyces punctatus DAOM BR117]|uniref:Pre-mRNA-splicing factor 38 n=1 Tax=Spizellomyces punctatus (strain DAOM BR117) TaxID=645134 RepID=A0A0L0H982_SPIPD|nr:uncharacterized protein SPPG_09470 [Spizellomyces punctatus DAOM BR117]KNC97504.1 hypothetical protein SPPG_09470 [Spizellomyces punctatus DAOM BR117]|eukprot:XP_016605544.1 hypothetical protein SPPG_09470 [Spizellomyces punctatus DAOM BR117]
MSTTDDSKRSKRLETVGNKDTMNLHNILYQNIISSPYFKSLYEKKTYHEVIDEIYNQVSSLEPFFKGTHASTAFCLLYKLWTLKLTVKQVQGLITHTDSAHIRALGFLYLRYVCKPADLWGWYEPYLDDDEELQVEAGAKPRMMSMGRFLRELLTDNKWIGTMLPRIPVPIARDIEKKLKENPPAHGITTDAMAGSNADSAPKKANREYISDRPSRDRYGANGGVRSEAYQARRHRGSSRESSARRTYGDGEYPDRREYSPRRYHRAGEGRSRSPRSNSERDRYGDARHDRYRESRYEESRNYGREQHSYGYSRGERQ